MAAPSPDLTEIVMASISHNGVAAGICKGLALQRLIEDLEISAQGSLGADSIGTVSVRQNVTLTYLCGPAIARDAFGDIVIVFNQAGGGTITHTIKNMLARGYTMSHTEKGELVYTQDFKNKSSQAASQHTTA